MQEGENEVNREENRNIIQKKLVLLAASNFSFSQQQQQQKTLKYLFLTIKYIIYRIGKANVSNCMCKK